MVQIYVSSDDKIYYDILRIQIDSTTPMAGIGSYRGTCLYTDAGWSDSTSICLIPLGCSQVGDSNKLGLVRSDPSGKQIIVNTVNSTTYYVVLLHIHH